MIATAAPHQQAAPASVNKENNNQQRGNRARGYSTETGRNGRSQPKGNLPRGNQNRTGPNDQRMGVNTPSRSPPRQVSQSQVSQSNQPIYVHNSQCVTPPHGGPSMAPRVFSDPQTRLKVISDDARLWDNSFQNPAVGPQPHQSHEPFERPTPSLQSVSGQQSSLGQPSYAPYHRSRAVPFENHPQAKITEKSSTFFYKKEIMDQKPDVYSNRTLYVFGADVDLFVSHSLKDMMSEVGAVESISYLYGNPNCGPAFIT